tara:strand:+ start:620 stop:889 length:270 start_codon:yes stop_codon:yes gene_type:complete
MYENVQEFLKSRHLHEDHINGNKEIYNKLLLNDSKLVVLFELKMLEDDKFKHHVMSTSEITKNMILLDVEHEFLYDTIVKIMNLYIDNH